MEPQASIETADSPVYDDGTGKEPVIYDLHIPEAEETHTEVAVTFSIGGSSGDVAKNETISEETTNIVTSHREVIFTSTTTTANIKETGYLSSGIF